MTSTHRPSVRNRAAHGLALLLTAAVASACASNETTTPDAGAPATVPSTVPAPVPPSPSQALSPLPSDPGPIAMDLTSLEAQFDARVGVFALDTGTGELVVWRADERFAYASTIKALAAAVVLDQTTDADLDQQVTYTADDLVPYSPITEQNVADGMTVRELLDAAVQVSDNTAANLLFEEIGGPAGLQEALAAIGDDVTQVERIEPDLNEAVPGDPRDTSTPRAMATSLQAFTVDDALEASDRAQLVELLRGNTTGDTLIRAAVPTGWVVGDKTGSAGFGTRNDIAILWPPDDAPAVVLAVMSSRTTEDADYDDALIAEAAEAALAALE